VIAPDKSWQCPSQLTTLNDFTRFDIVSYMPPTQVYACTQRAKSRGFPMFDVMMLILGVGAFAFFLGYVTVCEIL
jgi:hypothetical protein